MKIDANALQEANRQMMKINRLDLGISAYLSQRRKDGFVEVPFAALQKLHSFIRDEYGCTKSQALDGEFVSGEAREVWGLVCEMLASEETEKPND